MQPRDNVAQGAASGGRAPLSPAPSASGFDPRALEPRTWKDRLSACILERLLSYPQRLMAIGRFFAPVVRICMVSWVFVLRYDEVREVLNNSRAFPVDWGGRMKQVTGGENFVLGMPPDAEYKLSYKQLAEAFPRKEIKEHVAQPAAQFTEEFLRGSPREFDAVRDLITAVPTRLCRDYYGLEIADEAVFARATLAVSSYIFGPSRNDKSTRLALAAAQDLRAVFLAAIDGARKGTNRGVVVPRMLNDMKLPDEVIVAQMFGMVLGFIPTNVLAGGNMLETLLRYPDFMLRARTAALAGDDDLLWRCLREALRFRHINPGPWRDCDEGYTFGKGGPREIRIPPGSKVFALTQSAMFDERRVKRPHVFDPDRDDADYMIFGVGQHWCLGAYMAMAQLTQTFKPLLRLNNLHAMGNPSVRTVRFNGLFPLHLTVGYDP